MGKTYGYTMRDKYGRILYIGETNDLERREREHRSAGMPGNIKRETTRQSKASAEVWEEQRLDTYRRNHGGKNPPYNKQ